jgi:voltage-gated potassium channel
MQRVSSKKREKMRKILYSNRFLLYLISIILLLLAFPLADPDTPGSMLPTLAFTLVILSSLHAMQRERGIFTLAMIIGLPAIAARWIIREFGFVSPEVYADLFSVLFFALLCLFLLASVLGTDRITRDTISGAIGIYLTMGITWAYSYQLVDTLIPGALSAEPTEMGYLYFSFVTLTTLGYGDITPLIPATEMMAIFEAVAGQLYIAVLIARLVSSLSR